MGFRFRRRLRILPGLYLNVSKSGVTTSIGGRGATLNLSKRGMRLLSACPARGCPGDHRRRPGRARQPICKPMMRAMVAAGYVGSCSRS